MMDILFCIQNNFEMAQVCVMILPGSKGLKSDASLLAGGFLNLGPAENMNKKPFFKEK